MRAEDLNRFIESWGNMGALWGINRSMARIHALLMASSRPLSLDEIANHLQISRGNASMSLKELRNWRVVQLQRLPGDRRDFYESEPDVWTMFFRIAQQRKQREFDPALLAVQAVLEEGEEDPILQERFEQMQSLLKTGDQILSRFLSDPKSGRAVLSIFSALSKLSGS